MLEIITIILMGSWLAIQCSRISRDFFQITCIHSSFSPFIFWWQCKKKCYWWKWAVCKECAGRGSIENCGCEWAWSEYSLQLDSSDMEQGCGRLQRKEQKGPCGWYDMGCLGKHGANCACDMLSAERQVFSNWSVGQKNPCKGLKSTETPHPSMSEITSSIPNNTVLI